MHSLPAVAGGWPKQKHQAPNSKIQTMFKTAMTKAPNAQGRRRLGHLRIGAWCLFGIWCLELGAFAQTGGHFAEGTKE
jgi:hypothetical protein